MILKDTDDSFLDTGP